MMPIFCWCYTPFNFKPMLQDVMFISRKVALWCTQKGKRTKHVWVPKIFRQDGLPYQRKLLLGIEKKCWKNRSRCMSEFIVLKMERIKALNPSGLGRGVWWNCVARWWWFPKKRKFWPKWWPCVGCLWGRQTVEFEVIEVYGRSAFTEFWDPLNRLIHG